MKKIIMVAIAVMLILSTTSFAQDSASIFPIMKSGNVESDITFDFDSSGLLSALGDVSFIDSAYFSKGLSEIKLKCDENYDINDDYTKINLSVTIDMELPLNFNSHIQIGTKAKIGIWFEYDVTDESDPVCRIVIASPVDARYVVIDIVEEFRYRGYDMNKLGSDFKKYINKEKIEEYIRKSNEIFLSNATVTGGKNKKTVKLSGEQYRNCIKDIMEYFSGVLSEYEGLVEEYDFNADIMSEMPEGIDMSMVMEISYDSNGNITDADTKFSISFDEETAETSGITNFAFGGKSVYNNFNRPVSVDFPKLTAENSVAYYAMQNYYGDCEWFSVNCDYIPASGETFYVSLYEVMNSLRECGHRFTVENRGGNVVIKNTDKSETFDTLEMTVGSSEFIVDSEKVSGVNPVLYSDGSLFVDNKLLESVFGLTYSNAATELISGKTNVVFERLCGLNELEEDINEEENYYEDTWEESDYCGHFESMLITADYPDSDMDYFGIRTLVEEHSLANDYDGQYNIAYDNGVVTLSVNGAEDYFTTATVAVGSNIITVDGIEYETTLPAVNRDGKVYIDKDAIGLIMKYELKALKLEYPTEDTGFQRFAGFERRVPGCAHDYEEVKWYSSFNYYY